MVVRGKKLFRSFDGDLIKVGTFVGAIWSKIKKKMRRVYAFDPKCGIFKRWFCMSGKMKGLALTCADWAQQFSSEKILVKVNFDAHDDDYGQHAKISIRPLSLDMVSLDVIVVDECIGMLIENWGRVSRRLLLSGGIADHLAAAYIEPGVFAPSEVSRLLDAIAGGDIAISTRVFHGKVVGTKAVVATAGTAVTLAGPTLVADFFRIFGVVKTTKLDYVRWSETSAQKLEQMLSLRCTSSSEALVRDN